MNVPKFVLDVKLNHGLCNKLFHLFSACDIAIKNKYQILEPMFGWKHKILFSDIYNIDYFNECMLKYTINYNLIIKKNDVSSQQKIIKNKFNLWKISENLLNIQRTTGKMDKNCMNIVVLLALKINNKYLHLVDKYHDVFIHLRLESDWKQYSRKKKVNNNEVIYTNLDKFINIYNSTSFSKNDIFFTSGENQINIQNDLKKNGLISNFYFDKDLEYELNAAINFEIACKSNIFIGLSRSTYSNCISLKRSLLSNDENYIYNFQNKIEKRIDKGLQCNPAHSISMPTNFF